MRMYQGISMCVAALVGLGCLPDSPSRTESSGALRRLLSGVETRHADPFTLELVGVPDGALTDMTPNIHRRVFVPLFGRARVQLHEGSFAVVDNNGTDGSATFQLPSEDRDGDGGTAYAVNAVALGGKAPAKSSCARGDAGEYECSTSEVVIVRDPRSHKRSNVSRALLQIEVDVDGDGELDRVSLFDDRLGGVFWRYSSDGLRVANLRFREVPADLAAF